MEDKKLAKKKHILGAAFECFLHYGYSKTTFSDVAKSAGISRALIYQYFKNKKDLFVTMTDERHDTYTIQSAKVLESNLVKNKKLRKIINIWIIDPYRLIVRSPHPHTWLDELKNFPQSEKRYRELFLQSIAPLLGDDLAEVVSLSFKGLLDDRPTIRALEKRVDILITALNG